MQKQKQMLNWKRKQLNGWHHCKLNDAGKETKVTDAIADPFKSDPRLEQ